MKIPFWLLVVLVVFGAPLFGQNTFLHFDGIDDRIDIARTPLPTGLTYTAWVNTLNTDSISNYAGDAALNIFGEHTNSVYNGFGIHGGKARYNHADANSFWYHVESSSSVNDGSWHHIAATHDHISGDVHVFVDGILEGSGNLLYFQQFSAISRIGTGAIGDFYCGLLDELTVWNRALSQSEITTFKDIGLQGNESGLVLYYKLNDGVCGANNTSISIIDDASNSNLNGTPVNLGLSGCQENFLCNTAMCQVTPTCSNFAPFPFDLSGSAAVPTLSQWGLIFFVLVLMNIGAIALWKKDFKTQLKTREN